MLLIPAIMIAGCGLIYYSKFKIDEKKREEILIELKRKQVS
jgi:Na+/melibiose symporter-like transporter